MIVRLEIPQDLQRYFEFIPEEDLPQVCISALRDKVFSEERSKSSSSSEINIEELVSLLSKVGISSEERKLEETVRSSGESSPKNVQKAEKVVTRVEPIVFDDDDLDDFMGLMK